MNRATATCIAGMRSKTTSTIKTHFQRRLRPREAEPFTRRVFVLIFAIFAKRLRRRPERNPAVFRVVRAQLIRHRHEAMTEKIAQESAKKFFGCVWEDTFGYLRLHEF